MTKDLNDKEIKVFVAVCKSMLDEFGELNHGFADDVYVKGMNKAQVAGYLSQLVQKDFIRMAREFHSWMEITDKGRKLYDSL